jgi:hypothetical protein
MTSPIWKVDIHFRIARIVHDVLDYEDVLKDLKQNGDHIGYKLLKKKLDKINAEPEYTEKDIYNHLRDSYGPGYLELADYMYSAFEGAKPIMKRNVKLAMVNGYPVLTLTMNTHKLSQNDSLYPYFTEDDIVKALWEMSETWGDSFYEGNAGSVFIVPSKTDPSYPYGTIEIDYIEIDEIKETTVLSLFLTRLKKMVI